MTSSVSFRASVLSFRLRFVSVSFSFYHPFRSVQRKQNVNFFLAPTVCMYMYMSRFVIVTGEHCGKSCRESE